MFARFCYQLVKNRQKKQKDRREEKEVQNQACPLPREERDGEDEAARRKIARHQSKEGPFGVQPQ